MSLTADQYAKIQNYLDDYKVTNSDPLAQAKLLADNTKAQVLTLIKAYYTAKETVLASQKAAVDGIATAQKNAIDAEVTKIDSLLASI